jgi:hypothetical protein
MAWLHSVKTVFLDTIPIPRNATIHDGGQQSKHKMCASVSTFSLSFSFAYTMYSSR